MFLGIEKIGSRLLNLGRKDALLLGTSMLAWMAMSKASLADTTVAADATVSANEAGSVNFTADATLTVNDGISIAGAVDNGTGADNSGHIDFLGSSTVGGAIGTGNSLGTIAVGVTGSTVQLLDNVNATTIQFSSDGVLSLADGKTYSGAITSTTTGVGDITFEGAYTVAGQVGASANTIGTLTASTADSTEVMFSSDVYATTVNFGAGTDGTITLATGTSITGAIGGASASDGVLSLAGDNTITGDVGSGAAGAGTNVGTVSGGAAASLAQFNSDVYAINLNIVAADGTILLADGKSITGAVTNTAAGMLSLAGDNTVTGAIAAGTVMGGVSAKTTQLDDSVTATNVDFASDGTILLATGKSISGVVDNVSGTAGNGYLNFAGNATVGGAIGTTNTLGTVAGGVTATTVQLLGDVGATAIEISADGTVSLADGKTLSGAITSTTTGVGDIVFEGAYTVAGQVGASANTIGTLTASTADSTNVQFNSDVYATTVNFGAGTDGTITLATGTSITGAILGASASDGVLTLAGSNTITGDVGSAVAGTEIGTVTAGVASTTAQFDGDVWATNLTLSTGTTKVSGAARSITAATTLAAGGTLDIGTSAVTHTGAITSSAGGIIKTSVSSATATVISGGAVTVSTTLNMTTGAIQVDLNNVYITNGATFTVVNATTVTDNGTAITASAISSSTVTFAVATAGNVVTLTASRTSGGFSGASSGTSKTTVAGTSSALESLGANAVGAMATLIGTLDTLSATTLGTTLTQLTPAPANAGVAAATSVATSVGGVISARVASLQGHSIAGLDDGEKGISAGDAQKRNGVWMQIFGSWSDQDKRKGVDGYKADTYGAAAGVDTQVFDKGRIGLAFAYATTDIDGKGALSGNNTGVDSYIFTLYGAYNYTDALYFDGSLTYGLHSYDTLRVAPAVAGRATADHDTNQYSGKIGAGYNVRMGKATLTPMASIEYLYFDEDGYTETGAGGIPLTINSKTTDSLLLGIGARLSGDFKAGTMRYQPEIHIGGTFDALAGGVDTTSRFVGGGAAFVTPGVKPGDLAGNAGVGLSLFTERDIQLTATYDAQFKDRYESHTGSLKVRVPF